MANLLEIPPAFDSSTLVIQPIGPMYPLPAIQDDAAGVFVDQQFGGLGLAFQFGDDCTGCAAFIHESTVDAFILVEQFPSRDCSAAGVDGPGGSGQTFIDNLVNRGALLGELYPTWLLDDLGLDPEAPAVFDFWTLACLGAVTIPWPKGPLPLPPPCPPGQALNSAGVCVPIDPPVPRGVRNLSGPTIARNPTTQGAPTPFAMMGCGCGADDAEEIDYASSAAPSSALAGLLAAPNPNGGNPRASHVPRPRNRTRVLARAGPLPRGSSSSSWRHSLGPPTFGRDS